MDDTPNPLHETIAAMAMKRDWDWQDELDAELAVASGRMERARQQRWNQGFAAFDEFGFVTVARAYLHQRLFCWWHGVDLSDD